MVADNKKRNSVRRQKGWVLPVVLILVVALVFGIIYATNAEGIKKLIGQFGSPGTIPSGRTIEVHFIDVGQGDSALIKLPDGKTMLIDAGPTLSVIELENYLGSLGIKKIDYLIATHPHEDHIGGMAAIIADYEIGEIWAPKVEHDTRTYELFLNAVKKKGLAINTASAGKVIYSAQECTVSVLYPGVSSLPADINDSSAIILVEYGSVSFLFTGDAGVSIIASACKKQVDVLKVSHHGSYLGTDDDLVKKLKPNIAIISCAADNPYGYPHKEVMAALKDTNMRRTDVDGTIVVTSDGKRIQTEWGK